MILPIKGLDAVRRELGDFRSHILPDGTVARNWEENILGTVYLPEPLPLGWDQDTKVSQIRFHHLLCDPLLKVFAEIHLAGLWRELRTYDGAYAFRAQRSSVSKPSAHCWAAAIDLGAEWNQQHTQPTMHPKIVELFESRGFVWGGRWGPNGALTRWVDGRWTRPREDWTRCDGMHMQLVNF